MDFTFLIGQALTNGLIIGLLYLLMAIGFTLVFGVMRVVNFAHGEFYMLGAFLAYVCVTRLQLPFLAAVLATFAVTLVAGWIIEVLVLKGFRGNELNGMISTIGLAMVLQNGALLVFGPDPQSMPPVAEGVVSLGPIVLPMSRLYVVAFSIAVLVLLYLFLMHSKGGRALRAVVQDTEIASAQGIRSHLMYPLGFGIGVALAAVAGALMAPVFSVSPSIGSTPLLKAFIVVILGGLGSIPGAALASLLLGVVESAANTFMSSSMSDMLLFGFVILMLIFRPSGLLGKSGR
ncbi:branched-chain amino acid ABC transporter permease [Alicycliphilus denitrificans]|uniref:Branched-chain amino acid ABC transporter permease n=1 Tax=Alicycliphilus denitrificans TaxID=179636 RepID=A0A420KGP8_9BURK|nr:branched-chain amino acid ABC transporter permease [Alicycliphilus denitrificans]MBN9572999.1 branched-chain amino acid ABC transporter permease [Alicycliphilus denitrificans]OJW93129.1 MAG: branched-chain amino acid ABC transporter permease [Alicycliphilus sp. 69-12]RKJ99066.1 branched-chain amino acid ABC transporter permease [Alicycliphilus denitrificans]BCN37031.1 branched-chain amino acid ABC transporter permease [Alicycliphilus denitrificans]